MGPCVRGDDAGSAALRAAHDGLEVIIRLDDLDQAILGGAVAAIGVGMVLLHQRLVLRLDVLQRRFGGRAPSPAAPCARRSSPCGSRPWPRRPGPGRQRPRPLSSENMLNGSEAPSRSSAACLALLAAGVGAHLPGRTMAGQRILLVARDRIGIHALEEIVGLVVFADVIEAEVQILPRILPALGRAVRPLVLAARPFAHGGFFARLRLLLRAQLVGLDANGVEEFG